MFPGSITIIMIDKNEWANFRPKNDNLLQGSKKQEERGGGIPCPILKTEKSTLTLGKHPLIVFIDG